MLLECLFLLVRVVVFLFVCSCSRLLFLVYDIPRVFMHKLYRHLLVSHGCLSERVLLSVDVYLSCGCLCFTDLNKGMLNIVELATKKATTRLQVYVPVWGLKLMLLRDQSGCWMLRTEPLERLIAHHARYS